MIIMFTFQRGVIGFVPGLGGCPHALKAGDLNLESWCPARGSCACVMYAIMSNRPGVLEDDLSPPPGLNDDKLGEQRLHVLVSSNAIF